MMKISEYQSHIEILLENFFQARKHLPLCKAMAYSVLGGGKRLRALLAYATGHAYGIADNHIDSIAISLECVHAYSLIHDDLPAMDNDDFRRGKPSTHKAFGEAVAILAGDALQTEAFAILSDNPDLTPMQALTAISQLSRAIGMAGMAGGQYLDLQTASHNLASVEQLHRQKTGALIEASILMVAASCPLAKQDLESLKKFGEELGLAFQIQDDILDSEKQETQSYTYFMGLESAKKYLRRSYDNALEALSHCKGNTQSLADIARWSIHAL
jgi:geranylgeranyl pyrophosphate synthase